MRSGNRPKAACAVKYSVRFAAWDLCILLRGGVRNALRRARTACAAVATTAIGSTGNAVPSRVRSGVPRAPHAGATGWQIPYAGAPVRPAGARIESRSLLNDCALDDTAQYMGELVRSFLVMVLLGSSGVITGCSLVLDSASEQCSSDGDCAHFGGHPVCRDHLCVASGLGPPDCYDDTPTTQDQLANRCTTAQTVQFDNCGRLGLCSDRDLSGAMATALPPVPLGTVPPSVVTQIAPTVRCTDALTNIIYVTGSTNLPPLLRAVQPLLDAQTPPHTVVFAPQTSCKGVAAIYDPAPSKHLIMDIPNNWAFYYKDGVATHCLLDPAGNVVDVGESDVYPPACGYSATPGIADYPGPIQAITFVVPASSKQVAISAEAAHLVFGAGGNRNQTLPWTDPHLYFIRSSGTGTVQLPSRAIGLDPGAWWGIDRLAAPNVVASMEAIDPSLAEGAIGVLSSDFADHDRANLRMLAFQQHGQRYAYLPDSTPETDDKANVRDGHYPIWGAIHFMAATTIDGVPSETALPLIVQFRNAKLDQALVAAIIEAGFVPPCAMKVTHESEIGPLSMFEPTFGCSCFYDHQVGRETTCQACTTSSQCSGDAKVCNYGFCEKQ